ncbi:MAG: glycoside hydrolase family 5 protein [Bacteroides sp.]|nr:glycoside hydrolase family 5 protein [Bacteroides sp.]
MYNNSKRMSALFISAGMLIAALLPGCSGKEESDLTGTGVEIPVYDIEARELPENEAMTFVRNLKIGWNLGNTLDADSKTSVESASETSWGSPMITEEMIADINKAGFNTIRIPVTWHNHVDDDFNISDYWLGRVKEIVDYAYKRKMYVIINIHHDMIKSFYYPTYETLESSMAFSDAVWAQLCEAFKDYDEHLIFEGINEPRLKDTDNEWWIDEKSELGKEAVDCIMQINQSFVDLVRASGGNNAERYLMTPSYCASPTYACSDLFSLPNDPAGRTILSVHAYEPYNFALSDDSSSNTFVAGRTSTSIKSVMDSLYEKYTSKGIPVVIGEFGSRNKDNLEARIEHAAYYVSEARSAGISCVWWDNNAFIGNGELFGLYDRAEMTWKYPDIVIALMKNCG